VARSRSRSPNPDSTGGEIHFEPGEVEHDSGHEGRIDDHVLEQPPIDYAMPLIVIERTGGDFPAGFAGTVTIVPGGRLVDHGQVVAVQVTGPFERSWTLASGPSGWPVR
jgi:hypothetical protein